MPFPFASPPALIFLSEKYNYIREYEGEIRKSIGEKALLCNIRKELRGLTMAKFSEGGEKVCVPPNDE